MAKFLFDSYMLPCGELNMSFENDHGSQIVNCSGNFLLKLASLRETVEENGIGGIPRIADMEVEVYDREGWFRNTIFNKRAPVTTCYATFTLTVADMEYSILYGMVDFSTIEYESVYDDGLGTEAHLCKFVVMSIITSLRTVSMVTLRQILDTKSVRHPGGVLDIDYINITDLFQTALSMIYPGKDIALGYNLPFTLSNVSYGGFTPQAGYLFYKIDGTYTELWDDGSSSFMGMRDVESFLNALCSMMLVYPVISYNPANDSLNVCLRHRNGGNTVTNGLLLSSTLKTFYGYDAIRVKNVFATYDRRIFPCNDSDFRNGLSDDQFDLISQSYDYQNYLYVTAYNHFTVVDPSLTGIATSLIDTDTENAYTSWNKWLMTKYVAYWNNKKMVERKYKGVGIGESPIALLDKITLNDGAGEEQYSIFHIERDFVANEMNIRCVQY